MVINYKAESSFSGGANRLEKINFSVLNWLNVWFIGYNFYTWFSKSFQCEIINQMTQIGSSKRKHQSYRTKN